MMFENPGGLTEKIIGGITLTALGFFAKHIQIGWEGGKIKRVISPDLKRQLCQQIKGLEKRVNELQRKNDRLQKMIDKLVKENAELRSDNRGLLNSMAAFKAKVEKIACT